MTRRRLAALALALSTFAGCHQDPTVQQVVVPGSATALTIFTDGGTAATQGNAAGTGALIALLSAAARDEIEGVVRRVEKIETAVEPRFQEHFVDAMALPHRTAPATNLSPAGTGPLRSAGAGGATTRNY